MFWLAFQVPWAYAMPITCIITVFSPYRCNVSCMQGENRRIYKGVENDFAQLKRSFISSFI